MRNSNSKVDKVELLVMLGILVITVSTGYAIIRAAHTGYLLELERQANDTCRNIAGHKVPCPD